MDNFTFLLFALTAVAGAVFFGYPIGRRLGHRDGFELGERCGNARSEARENRIRAAKTSKDRIILRNRIITEDSK